MRIGLIGCGDWGRFILRDLRTLGCTVHAVVRAEEARKAVAQEFDVAVAASVDELPHMDGFVIAAPTVAHAEVAREALKRGVPVFCEKPLTPDENDAKELAQLAPDRLFVMDKWRYHAGILKLAEIARSGRLGDVIGLKTRRLGWSTPHLDVDAAWILLPHDLAIALEILGEIPDITAAVGEIIDGRVRALTTLGRGRTWHMSESSERATVNQRRIEVLGTEGTAVLEDSYSATIAIWNNPALLRPPPPPIIETVPFVANMPLLDELAAFLEHLRGGPPPKSSAAEGAAMVAMVAKARRLAGIDA